MKVVLKKLLVSLIILVGLVLMDYSCDSSADHPCKKNQENQETLIIIDGTPMFF